MVHNEAFYGKILLFGEYSVIFGSRALTIPYSHFSGELSFLYTNKYTDLDFAIQSNEHLETYARHIRRLLEDKTLKVNFDIDLLDADIEKGIYFESTIPQGYGVGSSGALVAALFKRYANHPINRTNQYTNNQILELKQHFAVMESYFHGTSSGMDPLNCYIGQPLLIESKDSIHTVDIPTGEFEQDSAIFLIDTEQIGKTEPLVNLFIARSQQTDYKTFLMEEYIPLNNTCIDSILNGNQHLFSQSLERLSEYQLNILEPMIPVDFQPIWQEGLNSGDYSLKLCGSGGGGFLLGFTRHWEKAKTSLSKHHIKMIPVYKPRKKAVY